MKTITSLTLLTITMITTTLTPLTFAQTTLTQGCYYDPFNDLNGLPVFTDATSLYDCAKHCATLQPPYQYSLVQQTAGATVKCLCANDDKLVSLRSGALQCSTCTSGGFGSTTCGEASQNTWYLWVTSDIVPTFTFTLPPQTSQATQATLFTSATIIQSTFVPSQTQSNTIFSSASVTNTNTNTASETNSLSKTSSSGSTSSTLNPPPIPTNPDTNNNNSSSSNNTGLIIGIVCGVLALLGIAGAVWYFVIEPKRKAALSAMQSSSGSASATEAGVGNRAATSNVAVMAAVGATTAAGVAVAASASGSSKTPSSPGLTATSAIDRTQTYRETGMDEIDAFSDSSRLVEPMNDNAKA
ncbi:hypothetical protein HDU76_010968 [Blyttiomyces sp. JEL0837]|nr:hypothetical protein HDU76_010968 [Blyttiomyces sp. JEL0837]